MNKRRRPQRRATLPGIILLIAVVAVMILVVIGLGKGLLGLLNLLRSDGGEMEPDPMFPEAREEIAPPAGLDETGAAPDLGEDPSQNWVYEELTPVDQTAAELAEQENMEP